MTNRTTRQLAVGSHSTAAQHASVSLANAMQSLYISEGTSRSTSSRSQSLNSLASCFSTLYFTIQISPNTQWVAKSEHARVNHVHDFRVPLSSLLFFELACPILQPTHVKLAQVILRSRQAKQTVATHAHPPS